MGIAEPQDALFKDSGVEIESAQTRIERDILVSLDDTHPLVKRLGKIKELPRCDYVYSYNAPSAHSIYGVEGEKQTVIFEQKVGEGLLLFVGIAPDFLVRSKVGADIIRSVSEYLSGKANIPYEKKNLLSVKRGPYRTVFATQDGVALKGPFIDLLDAKLPLIKQKNLDADEYALLYEVSPLPEQIQILYSSSVVENVVQESDKTSCQAGGPYRTVGAITIFSPSLEPGDVSAKDSVTGENLLVDWIWNKDGQALTVEYNHPAKQHKADILVEWRNL